VAENIRFCLHFRQALDDAADVADEAHVEHAVGFVEHQGLHLRQVDGALAEVVEQAAGRGDQDVDATAQGLDLRVDADAAEHGEAAQAGVGAIVRTLSSTWAASSRVGTSTSTRGAVWVTFCKGLPVCPG
jgi:hypothetical protein